MADTESFTSWLHGTFLLGAVSHPHNSDFCPCNLLMRSQSVRYGSAMSSTIKSRLSNSYLIGEIFGMLFFGVLIDRMGRRTGIVAATAFLVLGVVLATAAHGTSDLG